MEASKNSLFILALLTGMMLSCVKDPKDIPNGFTDDPVFGMKASFGNEVLDIQAGNAQWTMLPVVGQVDSLSVYSGVFSLNGCLENCDPSMTFDFYQALPYQIDPEQAFDNTIHPGAKELVPSAQEVDSFDVFLSAHPALFMSGYSYWLDLNGPSNTYYHEFNSVVGYQQRINVCFQTFAYTGCQYSQCISFDPTTLVPCLASIEPKVENARYISLRVRPEGTAPFQFLWANGDTTQNQVVFVQDSVAEVYAAVTVTDALGNVSEITQTVRIQNGFVDACYFPIELSSTPIENVSSSVYADRVSITYRDESGDIWKSAGGVQPSNAKVIIDSVNPYGPSPDNHPSYLVDLTITALLYNETTGESRLFETQQLTVALSHL